MARVLCTALPLLISLILVQKSQATRLLILADIHLNVNATTNYVRPGAETSPEMLQNVLNEAAKREDGQQIDAILMIGDLCKHGLAATDQSVPNPLWPLMLFTMQEAIQMIASAFPNIPVLPVIGNNDVEYHNEAPPTNTAFAYYTDMWDIYTGVPANNATWGVAQQTTFMTGGYYSYSIGNNITVLCLNGMYPFDENTNDPEIATTMISWVESQFQSNPYEKFIIQYHVWPGCNYYEYQECFWVQPYLDQFLTLLVTYKPQIITLLGAHIHHIEVMAP
jgi:Calcineurin-like phosphoesterase